MYDAGIPQLLAKQTNQLVYCGADLLHNGTSVGSPVFWVFDTAQHVYCHSVPARDQYMFYIT